MSNFTLLPRRIVGLLSACLLLAAPAHSATVIGYDPMSDITVGSQPLSPSTAFYVPFAFNVSEPYALDSVRLLLSGEASLNDFSLIITPTLGTNLSLPTTITATYSATGTLMGSASVITFLPDSAATFTPSSIYYLRLAYTGSDVANWVLASVATGGSGGEGGSTWGVPNSSGGATGGGGNTGGGELFTLNSILDSGQAFGVHSITNGGTTSANQYFGISLTATAIPEPSSFVLTAVALTVIGAFTSRLRRRQS